MLLIGSRALNYWVPDSREGADWDLFTTQKEYSKFLQINRDIITNVAVSDPEKHHILIGDEHLEFELDYSLINLTFETTINKWGFNIQVASPTLLYVIKKSHIHIPLAWYKHILDYHQLKPLVDKVEYNSYKRLLKVRREATDFRWNSFRTGPNLNKSNEQFFNESQDYVGRSFPHDALHIATCYYGTPLFDSLKLDKTKAKIERKLFEALSHEDKIRTVREEGYAIALERKVIPAIAEKRKYYPRAAFVTAIEKICTTLTSGWFREFAIDNAIEIMDYDVDYVQKWLDYPKPWLNKEASNAAE